MPGDVLDLELTAAPIKADLVSENLILRLYQPGGVPDPGDPWFDPIPGSGQLSQAEKDLLVKASQDAAIAAAKLQVQQSAQDISTSVLADARQLLDQTFEANVTELKAEFQSEYLSVAAYELDVGARVDEKAAAIQEKLETYVDTNSALAQRVDLIAAGTDSATVAIESVKTAYADADSALGRRIDATVADIASNRASITDVDDARADDYQALSNRMTTIESTVSNDVDAKIQTLSQTVASNYAAQATQIQTVTTTLNGHTSTINVQQQSINGVSARYGVQLDVNGWMVGWVANNSGNGSGSVVITAPKFVVAYPGYDAIAPFQVSFNNGRSQVSMSAAYIQDATIGTAKIADLVVTNAKIANAAIDSAKIGFAAIATAHIGEAQIDTLRVAGQAITIVQSFGVASFDQTFYSGGGDVVMFTSGSASGSNSGNNTVPAGSMTIYVDGVARYSGSGGAYGASLSGFVRLGNIGAGNHTFHGEVPNGSAVCSVCFIECKR